MKKTIILLTILFMCIIKLNAQSNDNYSPALPEITPPSPTSRVMQKFIGYPVSHSTGTIDINIPFYTLNINNLSIPVGIKYHSSGVRVQDPIGIVGRNWSMSPGFKISRTMVSKPDEIYPVTDIGVHPSIDDQIFIASPYRQFHCAGLNNSDGALIDGQYDIFQVHFPGIDVSFILKYTNGEYTAETIPDSPVKITPKISPPNAMENRLYGFEIRDDKGITYCFGEASPITGNIKNYIERNVDSSSNPSYLFGWMLREIILPGDSKVKFTYEEVIEHVQSYGECEILLDNGRDIGMSGCPNSYSGESPFWEILGSEGFKHSYFNGQLPQAPNSSLVPKAIISGSDTINFQYSSNMLSQMTVKSFDETVKRINLSYTSLHKLLKKVSVSGEGEFLFTYKDEENTLITNGGFDWWGFYNGRTNRYSNLPDIELSVNLTRHYITQPSKKTIGGGANRIPDASYMDARSLTEITYPTKGKLKITYEPHTYKVNYVNKMGGGLRVKSTRLYDSISGKTVTKTYNYEVENYLGRDYPDQRSLVTARELCPTGSSYCKVRQRTLSTFSSHPHVRGMSNPVWYSKVTEITDEGKSEYIYDYKPDQYRHSIAESNDGYINYEYFISLQNKLLYPAPWLVSATHFRKGGNDYTPVERTTYKYNHRTRNEVGTVAIPYYLPYNGYSNCQFRDLHVDCGRYYNIYGSPIRYFRYYITKGIYNISSTEKCTYLATDSIVERTSWEYDTERPYNVSQKKTLLSGSNELIEKYYYSNNNIPDLEALISSEQNAISQLTTNNYLTTMVQKVLVKNGTRLSSVLNGFYDNEKCLLQNIYYQKSTGAFENRINFQKYDSFRNPVYVVKDGTEHAVYIWGNDGKQLVAEVHNATYEDVDQVVPVPENWSHLYLQPVGYENLHLLLSRIPLAQTTCYIYKGAIGIKKIIATNGTTQTYEYDNEARLYRIVDHTFKPTEEYIYNFKP